MSPLVLWLLASFASWRIAHLIARDSFPPTLALRRWRIRKSPTGFVTTLLACPLCVSAYSAGAVLGGMAVAGYSVPAPGLLWLATWGGASFIVLAVE